MKILMFGWEFPPHISGGLGVACQGLCQGLAAHTEVEILLVTPTTSGIEGKTQFIAAREVAFEKDKLKEISKVKTLQVPIDLSPYLKTKDEMQVGSNITSSQIESVGKFYPFTGTYGPNLHNEVSAYIQTALLIAMEHTFDVIHAHDWMTFSAAIAVKQCTGKPLIVHIHSTEYDRNDSKPNAEILAIETKGLKSADQIIAVSERSKKMLVGQFGIDENKIAIIYNGVAKTPKVSRQQKPSLPKITFLGRITAQKGPKYFVEAAQKVLKETQQVQFVMAGSGDLLNEMIGLTVKLGIKKYFDFTGFLNKEEVTKLFAESNLYVMPSISEPFGITALEAAQSRTPLVITHQSGVAEVLPDALKLNYWEVDKLCQLMKQAIIQPNFGKKSISSNAEESIKLNWDWAATKVYNLYKKWI